MLEIIDSLKEFYSYLPLAILVLLLWHLGYNSALLPTYKSVRLVEQI